MFSPPFTHLNGGPIQQGQVNCAVAWSNYCQVRCDEFVARHNMCDLHVTDRVAEILAGLEGNRPRYTDLTA